MATMSRPVGLSRRRQECARTRFRPYAAPGCAALLKEIEPYECSFVSLPMNPAAAVETVKAGGDGGDNRAAIRALRDTFEAIHSEVLKMGADLAVMRTSIASAMRSALDGHDADLFMLAFKQEFDVGLSNFNFDRYFGSEGLTLSPLILGIVGVIKRCDPLTNSAPFDAANQHRWPERSPG
jgi:hypothetical protein